MPSRGYRKGQHDNAVPVTAYVRARITDATHRALLVEAAARSLTVSKLNNAILTAHIEGQRTPLPHARQTNAEALRELARLGNNLNQLARQANTAIVPLTEDELRHALTAVLKAIDRL